MEDVAAAAGITKLIVYRHFGSKQELYDAVLEGVAERTRDRFLTGLDEHRPGAGAVHALLAVAREDPAAFTLLWRHAAREPQFAEHAETIRLRGVRVAQSMLAGFDLGPARVRRWAAATVVSYLIGGILNWLDDGDPSMDDDVADLLAVSSRAMVSSWAVTDDQVRPGGASP
jgi:AcrR family transcriptional regulator